MKPQHAWSEQLRLFGLLHVADDRTSNVNLKSGLQSELDVYLRCAYVCGRSALDAGYEFTLLTNAHEALEERAARLCLKGLKIASFSPKLRLPPHTRFYSAHFKLDIIRELGSGDRGDFVGLIDIDTVVLRPLKLQPSLDMGMVAYDISEQVFEAYGADVVKSDLCRLADISRVGRASDPRWYGGEYLLGTSQHFAELAQKVDAILPAYVASLSSFHHVGDEMVVCSHPFASACVFRFRAGRDPPSSIR